MNAFGVFIFSESLRCSLRIPNLGAILFLKILSFLLNVGIFMLTIPIKILAFILATFAVVFVLVPVGLVSGLAGLILVPLVILIPLLPFALLLIGVILLLKKS
jgi:hypothetical protein